MFERFTDDARGVVTGAQDSARRLGHGAIGSQHLLLSLIGGDSDVAELLRSEGLTPEAVEAALVAAGPGLFGEADKQALATLGIDLDVVRDRIEAAFGPRALDRDRTRRRHRRWRRHRECPEDGEPNSGWIRFTPEAKKCLELSLREALALRSRHIGVEHIAMALTWMADGVTPAIFAACGVTPEAMRRELRDRYRQAG